MFWGNTKALYEPGPTFSFYDDDLKCLEHRYRLFCLPLSSSNIWNHPFQWPFVSISMPWITHKFLWSFSQWAKLPILSTFTILHLSILTADFLSNGELFQLIIVTVNHFSADFLNLWYFSRYKSIFSFKIFSWFYLIWKDFFSPDDFSFPIIFWWKLFTYNFPHFSIQIRKWEFSLFVFRDWISLLRISNFAHCVGPTAE